MKIRELMSSRMEMIPSNESLAVTAALMQRADVGCLPVVEGGQLVGVVTDRDLVVRGIGKGLDPRTTEVREVMTAACATIPADATPTQCADVMRNAQVHRIVVLDENRRPIGIVSTGDLAQRDPTVCGSAMAGITAE